MLCLCLSYGGNDDEFVPSSGKSDCESKGGFWCTSCNGFCTSGISLTCNQAAEKRCGAIPETGAYYITGICTATYNISCTCDGVHVCFDRGQPNGSQCNTPDGLCAVYRMSKNQYTLPDGTIASRQPTSIYYCPNKFLASQGKGCQDQKISSIPKCFCGTIQVDIPGVGFKTYESHCSCETEKPTKKPIPTPTPTRRPTRTPTPTPPPNSTPTPTPTPNPTETPPPNSTPTPTPPYSPICNSSCALNSDCPSTLICFEGNCRNSSCTSASNCICQVAAAPTPKTPVSGGPTILGASVIGIGMLILILGLAL